jgi:hypothetical protein
MKRFATGTLIAFVAFALGSGLTVSASAALPEIHMELGESFPLAAEGVAKGEGAASLSTALAMPIIATEAKLLLVCEKLGSSCPYSIHLQGAKFEGKECSTAGDNASVILIAKNEIHFVSTSFFSLDLDGDFLIGLQTVTCTKGAELLKITIEGDTVGRIEGVKDMEQVKTFILRLKCTKPNNGKQEIKEYLNDEGKLVKGTLRMNLGLGNETGCEEIKEPLTVTAFKMFAFLF